MAGETRGGDGMSYSLSRQQAEAEASEYLDARSIELIETAGAAVFRAQAALIDACNAFNRTTPPNPIDVESVSDALSDYLPTPDFLAEQLAEVTPPQRN